jgi:flagellar biosynthetic protein FliR
MELLSFDPEQLKVFFLVLIRVSVVLFLFPIFGGNLFPMMMKAGLSLALSLLFFPIVTIDLALFPDTIPAFVILVASELVIGLALGLTIRLFFAGVQLAGKLIGFQMGFAIINVMDPQSGTQVSIIDQIGYWVVLLVFLGLNGHHLMISALGESFHLVNIGVITLSPGFYATLQSIAADLFVISLKIGSPAIAALLFVSAAFGISAKFAPQMNILIAAFPVKIIVGLMFFGVSIQIIAAMTRTYVVSLYPMLISILTWVGGK